jgi:glycosyltransferase involved in cell wall biosynthesis
VRRDGYVFGNRIGELLAASGELDPIGREQLDGFLVESELQAEPVRRFHPTLPVAAIPLMAFIHAPAREPRPSTNGLRVAFLGRYDRAKGIYRLLDLWPQLPIQPARLDFYGHGAEREGLQREVGRRALESSVEIHGGWTTSDELTSILAGTDLVVLPSETEGLPLVLLEAMAHGVPFVASDVGAIRTLAEDNPDVSVVPLDSAALAVGIAEMAVAIRTGRVSGPRLQEYHRRRYSCEKLACLWAEALLEPERFWAERRRASSDVEEPLRVGDQIP